MSMRPIIVPALIPLALTILRLMGKLQHWSARWFSSETIGITLGSVAGILATAISRLMKIPAANKVDHIDLNVTS